ncbi:MAG: zinc ABC transporter substrate-binding protein [Jhaorihella sp.]
MRPLYALFTLALALAGPLRADVPRVVADIAPVHSLVAQVMDGLGTPDLLVASGTSPHGAALRPSQARALQGADLVVWIGPELTPWLAKPVVTLAGQAALVGLLDHPGTARLEYRDSMAPESGAEHGGHGHDHAGTDPHAWLDPDNASLWLGVIAAELAALDPANAESYRANAAAGQDRLAHLSERIEAQLAPLGDRPHVAFHDAFQYFEHRFGLTLAGSVALGDATDPGPARLAALRDRIAAMDLRCAFGEPQMNAGLLRAAADDGELRVVELDPLGMTLVPGPALYPDLLSAMADAVADCLNR